LHEVIAAALRGGPFEVIQSFRFSPEQAERFLNIMDGIEHDKAKAYEAPDVISQEVPW
jgi:hypothetical protein